MSDKICEHMVPRDRCVICLRAEIATLKTALKVLMERNGIVAMRWVDESYDYDPLASKDHGEAQAALAAKGEE